LAALLQEIEIRISPLITVSIPFLRGEEDTAEGQEIVPDIQMQEEKHWLRLLNSSGKSRTTRRRNEKSVEYVIPKLVNVIV
jgi:hypothetical protein